MTIAVVIPASLKLGSVIPWCACFARHLGDPLHIYHFQESVSLPANKPSQTDDTQTLSCEQNVTSILEKHEIPFRLLPNEDSVSQPQAEALDVKIVSLRDSDPTQVLLDEFLKLSPSLVILPRHYSTKLRSSEFDVERKLFQQVCSPTMQIRLPLPETPDFSKTLVATGHESSSRFALNLAVKLAQAAGGTVDALYIQPDVGPLAEQVGHERLQEIIDRAVTPPAECLQRRVLITKDISSGFKSIRSMDHNLILIGAEYHSVIERKLFSNVAEQLISGSEGPPVAVVRPAMPFQDQVRRRVERFLLRYVPQIEREQRVSLVERIQQSSEWDIDFIALIVLSTLIAALGLIQNSTAVVIGAMLVAPLMTPLLGSGLSLIQGNKVLARKAARTILLGFLTAYFLGVILGLLTPGLEVTSEMAARGSPRLPDIIIAFLSGMAAVYAMGRPHLVSALPGVAIAAALVPPIATAGLATSLGAISLACGSALLFLTNIVTIVLGGAASWWIIGFRDTHEHGGFGTWGPRVAGLLLVIAICLGIYESWPRANLTARLELAVEAELSNDSSAMLLNLQVVDFHHEEVIRVTLGGPEGLSNEINRRVESVIRNNSDQSFPVQIEWHTMWRSDAY